MLHKYLLIQKLNTEKNFKFIFVQSNKQTSKINWMIDLDFESVPTYNVSQCPILDCSQQNHFHGIPIMNLYVVDKEIDKYNNKL